MNNPERRASRRWALTGSAGPIRFVRLSADGGDGDREFSARLEEVSGQGMRLVCPEPLESALALRIECPDRMLLGEVRHCQPDGSGGYSIGVKLVESLMPGEGLRRLLEELRGEAENLGSPAVVERPVSREG